MRAPDSIAPMRPFGTQTLGAREPVPGPEAFMPAPRVEIGALLELLPDGAVVLDGERRVVATNAAFRRTLRRRGALTISNRVLAARNPDVDRRFAARVAAVAHAGGEYVLRVPVPAAADAIELRIAPLRGTHDRALVAVVVHDAPHARSVCAARLRELHDLTRAEAEVAVRLADGCSLEGAAESLGISRNTVRTHVRHLFAKCGVSTQAALLQRLALGAARVGRTVAAACDEVDAAASTTGDTAAISS